MTGFLSYSEGTLASGWTSGTSIPLPTGATVGDWVVAVFAQDAVATSNWSMTSTTGSVPWTKHEEVAIATPDGADLITFSKILTATDISGGVTVSAGSGSTVRWKLGRRNDVDTTTPLDGVTPTIASSNASNVQPVTATLPAITPATAGDIILGIVQFDNTVGTPGTQTWTPSGIATDTTSTDGAFCNLWIGELTAGAGGTPVNGNTVKYTDTGGSNAGWIAVSIALKSGSTSSSAALTAVSSTGSPGTVTAVVTAPAATAFESSAFQSNVFQLYGGVLSGGAGAALTGVAATGSPGGAGVTLTAGIVANAATGSAQAPAAVIGAALVGASLTASVVGLTSALTAPLAAVSGAGTATNPSPTTTLNLVGVTAAASVGTVTASQGSAVTLTGVAATGSVASVTSNFAAAVVGIAATGSPGALTTNFSVTFAGVNLTAAVNSPNAGLNVTLAGATGAGVAGATAATASAALAGAAATGLPGSVAPSQGAVVDLTGVAVAGSVTSLGVGIVVGTAGVSAAAVVGTVGIGAVGSAPSGMRRWLLSELQARSLERDLAERLKRLSVEGQLREAERELTPIEVPRPTFPTPPMAEPPVVRRSILPTPRPAPSPYVIGQLRQAELAATARDLALQLPQLTAYYQNPTAVTAPQRRRRQVAVRALLLGAAYYGY